MTTVLPFIGLPKGVSATDVAEVMDGCLKLVERQLGRPVAQIDVAVRRGTPDLVLDAVRAWALSRKVSIGAFLTQSQAAARLGEEGARMREA